MWGCTYIWSATSKASERLKLVLVLLHVNDRRLADLFASQLGGFTQFNSRHKTITNSIKYLRSACVVTIFYSCCFFVYFGGFCVCWVGLSLSYVTSQAVEPPCFSLYTIPLIYSYQNSLFSWIIPKILNVLFQVWKSFARLLRKLFSS